MIIHIDMDAFFASIEQAINPYLKEKPLIVIARPNKYHSVVCAASYQAKALGIDSGMLSSEALKICPNLKIVVSDQSKYIWTSEQIYHLLKKLNFPLRYVSIDEFQLDIGQHNNPLELAKKIQEEIKDNFSLTASLGIAKNWLLAKLASKINKPCGIVLITEENLRNTLATIAINKLCGIGEKLAIFLGSLGLNTCLDLYLKPESWLRKNLGKAGERLYHQLHNNEKIEEDKEEKPKSIGHSHTFSRTHENTGFIQGWVRLLSEMIAARLREEKLVSRSQHIWLQGPDIGHFQAQMTFFQGTNDGYEIYQRFYKIMAKKGPKKVKIRALGITCSKLEKIKYPTSLLFEIKRREELIEALDKINCRFGERTIFPATIALHKY